MSEEKETSSAENKTGESIRVPVIILENLMNMVGELVLVRNQHIQYGSQGGDSELENLNQRLNHVTSQLQEEVMKTRMQKIGSVLNKFSRVVRELSKSLEKKCKLVLEGTETELDKTLIEAIKDPLMHIVRNAVDHGIELASEREKLGKDIEGLVVIRSYHEGGQVIVEITDDGKGLNVDSIGKKGIEKGLVTNSELSKMSEREILMMIFAPGFSTAEKISNVSGRGVGMDVVKTNIEKIGGNIDLSSRPGEGTTIKLRIPLTLAIIPALIVRSGTEKFSIPQVKLVELVKIEKDEHGEDIGIDILEGALVYHLRGQLLPLVRLNEILNLDRDRQDANAESIVVLSADEMVFGLIVDEIEDSTDIVVKPLMQLLKDLSLFSGATILGDGNIALTLDVSGIAERAGLFSKSEIKRKSVSNGNFSELNHTKDSCEYLLVDIGVEESYALPLTLVHRLEEFSECDIKKSGNQDVIKYNSSLLPLLDIPKKLALSRDHKDSETDKSSVIVVKKSGLLYGLKVRNILDIVKINGNIDTDIRDRPEVLGNIIEGDHFMIVLDVMRIIDSMTDHLSNKNTEELKSDSTGAKILLVEDNKFYRNYISDELNKVGFVVSTVKNGQEAIDLLDDKSNTFDLIVSDIEMPLVDGITLAKTIRKNGKFSDLPMIALSSKYNDDAIAEGLESGFNLYLEKLNLDELIENIAKNLDHVSEAVK